MSASDNSSAEEESDGFSSEEAFQRLCEMDPYPTRHWEKQLEGQLEDVLHEIGDIESALKCVLSNVRKHVQIYAESAGDKVAADLLLKTKDALFLLNKAREQVDPVFEVTNTLCLVDVKIRDLQELAVKLNKN